MAQLGATSSLRIRTGGWRQDPAERNTGIPPPKWSNHKETAKLTANRNTFVFTLEELKLP
jgi:hypothetical protein